MLKMLLWLPLILVACQPIQDRWQQNSTVQVRRSLPHEQVQQLIFFGVLEGLYRDGVETRVASAIANIDEPAGIPHNFVYGCPICMPALDALRVYAARPGFYRDKIGRDTFGSGLDPAVQARLLSDDNLQRRDALQQLIDRWVAERTTSSGFDDQQREALAMALKEMRKKGMGLLYQFQSEEGPDIYLDFYRDWQACPSCDGANGDAL
ncbi:MAG: hypothetical protein DSY92_09485 [Planctomycetota bacterium]|nr:MAG: hypothetical protein DSY92_09485 [Planctomycetota bacterium]